MKLKKFIAGLTSACTALTMAAVSAFAYDVNMDFKTGWSINTTIPASEFENLTADSVITITYTADASLSEKADHSYWVIKPMINDAGWPLISDITCGSGMTLAESGDSYSLDVDDTQAQFSITGDSVEHLKTAGMALMGHGITLETLTIDNNSTLDTAPAEEDAVEETEAPEAEETVEETEVSVEAEDAAETEAEPETDAAPVSDNNTEMPVTGNRSAAAVAAAMVAAAVAMTASRKKK